MQLQQEDSIRIGLIKSQRSSNESMHSSEENDTVELVQSNSQLSDTSVPFR
jgi:hypothetical protein